MGDFNIKVKAGEFNKTLEKLARRLESATEEVRSNVHTEMQIIGNDLVTKIKLSMRNTPRASHFYKRGNKSHHPSMRGNPPAIDSGDLVNSILFDDPKTLQVEIGATQMHGLYLEDPENRGLNRKWLQPAYEEEEDRIVDRLVDSASAAMGEALK